LATGFHACISSTEIFTDIKVNTNTKFQSRTAPTKMFYYLEWGLSTNDYWRHKTRVLSYHVALFAWSYVLLFWHNTGVW